MPRLLLLACLVAACTPSRPSPAPDAGATATTACSAAEPPAPPPRDRPWYDRTDFDCDPAALARLEKAVESLIDNPSAIPPDLDAARFPVAKAYLAYAAVVTHRDGEVTALSDDARTDLAGVGPDSSWSLNAIATGLKNDPPLLDVLRLVRVASDDFARYCVNKKVDPAAGVHLFSCKLFEKHPLQAILALRPVHGDVADIWGFGRKNECADELVRKSLPAEEAGAVVSALLSLEQALVEVRPRVAREQYEHDAYISSYYYACGILADELLAPGVPEAPQMLQASLTRAVAKASLRDRSTPDRVARFKATRSAKGAALARGICAVAARREIAMTDAECLRRVKDATTFALADWLSWER